MATAVVQLASEVGRNGTSFNAKLLKPLDEALRCRICFEYFTDCMITKCSHNYCSLCIRRYMACKSQCPTCFRPASEPELQNNRLIDEVLQIYIKVREALQLPDVDNSDRGSGSKDDENPGCKKHTQMDTSESIIANQSGTGKETINIPDEVSCPVCYNAVPNKEINFHLDRCLRQSKERSERKYLPKLVYHLLKDKQIKEKLKEHGLSTSGDRQSLIRRHKNFLLLYNANCDSLKPKPVSDLLIEIERQELEEKLNAASRNVPASKRSDPFVKTDPTEIDLLNETYVQEHRSQFASLLQDVQQRELNRIVKTEKEDSRTSLTSSIVDKTGKQIGEASLQIGNAPQFETVTIKQEPTDSLPSTDTASETSDESKEKEKSVSTPKKRSSRSQQAGNKTLPYRIKKNFLIKLKNEPATDSSDDSSSDISSSGSFEKNSAKSKILTSCLKKKNVRKLSVEDGDDRRKK